MAQNGQLRTRRALQPLLPRTEPAQAGSPPEESKQWRRASCLHSGQAISGHSLNGTAHTIPALRAFLRSCPLLMQTGYAPAWLHSATDATLRCAQVSAPSRPCGPHDRPPAGGPPCRQALKAAGTLDCPSLGADRARPHCGKCAPATESHAQNIAVALPAPTGTRTRQGWPSQSSARRSVSEPTHRAHESPRWSIMFASKHRRPPPHAAMLRSMGRWGLHLEAMTGVGPPLQGGRGIVSAARTVRALMRAAAASVATRTGLRVRLVLWCCWPWLRPQRSVLRPPWGR